MLIHVLRTLGCVCLIGAVASLPGSEPPKPAPRQEPFRCYEGWKGVTDWCQPVRTV